MGHADDRPPATFIRENLLGFPQESGDAQLGMLDVEPNRDLDKCPLLDSCPVDATRACSFPGSGLGHCGSLRLVGGGSLQLSLTANSFQILSGNLEKVNRKYVSY
jgi:hypothetical protein